MEKPHISRLGVLYLSLGLAQTAHSAEEMLTHLYDFFWIVSGTLHRMFAWYPQFRWPADLFGAVNMILSAVLLGSWPFVERRNSWALYLAGIAGGIETLNGINHLAAAAVFRAMFRERSRRRFFWCWDRRCCESYGGCGKPDIL